MKSLFTLVYTLISFLLLNWSYTHAQDICQGNLGENIFENGDFGSGNNDVLLTDPNIAPGYTYTTTVPPGDGFYSIVNTTAFPNLFPTWIRIQDNSDDPNGYMMLVNASFSPGIFYEQTINNLCENTLYEFSADVINVVGRGVTNHILPNVSFLLDDVEQITTGGVPQDETWKTYGFTFITPPGQTSVKLTLRNNAPGGIGNDLALDNISFRACGPEALILPTTIANICEDGDPIPLEATIVGDQYDNPAIQWQESTDGGFTWVDLPGENDTTVIHNRLSSGFYYYRYLIASGPTNLDNTKCRIISNTKVVHVVPKEYLIVDTICQGNTYEVGTSTYDSPGVYVDSLISSIGCDSIVTLELAVVPDQGITATIDQLPPSCFGFSDASLTINGVNNVYDPFQISIFNSLDENVTGVVERPSGAYRVEITDRHGCQLITSVSIVDPPLFEIELGPDTIIPLGRRIAINPGTNYEIGNMFGLPKQ